MGVAGASPVDRLGCNQLRGAADRYSLQGGPGSLCHGPRAQVLAVATDFAAAAAAEPGAAGRPRRAHRRERCPRAE